MRIQPIFISLGKTLADSNNYESLFRNASEMFSDMVGRLTKEQKSNIMKWFCTVKPYFA